MNFGIERRHHPRVAVDWSVTTTISKGAIKGKTSNISISGLALIIFSEMPDIGDEFQVTIKPSEDHEMKVTCEKIWSGNFIVDESVCIGIGVRFTKISSRDRQIIATLVAAYQTN